jgi:manganese/zinc/iron transport system ATP- binding protein
VVEMRGVSAGYDGRAVIGGVDLTVRAGELVALVGANGAGKSTLLKCAVGLLRPLAGSVRVLGDSPAAAAPRIAYLPQSEDVRWEFPLRVEDVVRMGAIGRNGARSDPVTVRGALERVDAVPLLRQPVSALSGGQRQRVLLARALVADAQLLLLDEPATGVDPTTEEELMSVLASLAGSGTTILVATHDLAGVMAHFPRVVCMNGGIVADGPVSILRDDEILRRTYGGHRPGADLLIADEHHA